MHQEILASPSTCQIAQNRNPLVYHSEMAVDGPMIWPPLHPKGINTRISDYLCRMDSLKWTTIPMLDMLCPTWCWILHRILHNFKQHFSANKILHMCFFYLKKIYRNVYYLIISNKMFNFFYWYYFFILFLFQNKHISECIWILCWVHWSNVCR